MSLARTVVGARFVYGVSWLGVANRERMSTARLDVARAADASRVCLTGI